MRSTDTPQPSAESGRPRRRTRRASARRYGRMITWSFLRGAATAAGSALIGLLVLWFQHHL